MELSENAGIILEQRYRLKDPSGKIIETPDEMFMRVAVAIARAEDAYGNSYDNWAEKYFEIMSSRYFLTRHVFLGL